MRKVRPWLAVMCVAACGGGKLAAPHLSSSAAITTAAPIELSLEPFVIPGEHLLMELRLHGIPAARFEAAIGQPGQFEGRPALLLWSEMKSGGLLAVVRQTGTEVTTTLDLETGYPLHTAGSFEALFRGRRKNSVHRQERRWPASERQHNIQSMLILLRSWDAPEGTRAYLRGRVGPDSYYARVVAAGRELIQTSDGKVPAVKTEGIVTGWKFAIWFSDDRDRRPLRIDVETIFGIVRVELTAYERPN